MKKRLIAACVLASLSCWSIPVALASVAEGRASTGQTRAQDASPDKHDHSCCPGVHPRLALPVLVELAPATLPCDQHPCCVKKTPANPSALPAATSIPRPGAERWADTCTDQNCDGRKRATVQNSGIDRLDPYSSRSQVLRN